LLTHQKSFDTNNWQGEKHRITIVFFPFLMMISSMFCPDGARSITMNLEVSFSQMITQCVAPTGQGEKK